MTLEDSPAEQSVTASNTLHSTPVFDVVEDTFRFGAQDEELTRAYIRHLSAVAVLAVTPDDRVLLINQYRHPARARLWEVPAGLLDVEGETMLATAQRELYEEADLRARTWHTLVDLHTSPGCSDEAIRVYLAQDLTEVPTQERHARSEEEAELETLWVPLEDAVQAVLGGRVHNPTAVSGLLAFHAVRTGAGALRDPQSRWEHHPRGFTN